jgi:hypothetical protein
LEELEKHALLVPGPLGHRRAHGKAFDNIFVWIFILAIIALVISSGSTDKLITGVGKLISDLTAIIVSPGGKANGQ